MSANNTVSALNLSNLPVIAWPTYEATEPTHLPAESYRIAGDNIPADALAERLAELGVGSWPIMVGRLDPADGFIDFREAGWLTIGPDGSIELEPADD